MLLLYFSCSNLFGQNLLGELELAPSDQSIPMVVRTNNAYVFIKTNLQNFDVESSNPNYEKNEYLSGIWYLKIEPEQTYIFQFKAKGFITTEPIRIFCHSKEIRRFELMVRQTISPIEVSNKNTFGDLYIDGELNYSILEINGVPYTGELPFLMQNVRTGTNIISTKGKNIYVSKSEYRVQIRANTTDTVNVSDSFEAGYVEFNIQGKPYQIFINDNLVCTVTSYEWKKKSDDYLIVPSKKQIAIPLDSTFVISIRKPAHFNIDKLISIEEKGSVVAIKNTFVPTGGSNIRND